MTEEEMREAFLDHLRHLVDYWADSPPIKEDPNPSVRSRLSGLAHSFLVMLSGCASDIPSFDLIPSPHPDDEEFRRTEDRNWWVPEDINCGGLGSLFYNTPNGQAWRMHNRLKNTTYSPAQHRTFREAHAAIEKLPKDFTQDQRVATILQFGVSVDDFNHWMMGE